MQEVQYHRHAGIIVASLGLAVIGGMIATKVLKTCRIGQRRTSKPKSIIDNESLLIEERETSLIQQWYTDQPCQRLYGITFAASFSREGLMRLQNKDHVRKVILALIRRHPILSTTVIREQHYFNGRARLRRTQPKAFNFDLHGVDHPLGPVPVEWHDRQNEGTWRDIAHGITHTNIDESSWLFRVAIVAPSLECCEDDRSICGEIIVASNHLIADGLSTLSLIKDIILGISTNVDDYKEMLSLLSPLPLLSMEDVLDVRPPLGLIMSVFIEDILPLWLRKIPHFWQGPTPNVTDPVEGHLATIVVPPVIVTKLIKVAKDHGVTLHGLLSSILLTAEAQLVQRDNEVVECSVPLKFLFPMGRGTRQLANISCEHVGNFFAGGERIFNIYTDVSTSNNAEFWKTAKDITECARNGVREALDFLGLLNFLPRDSFAPWFIHDGNRYVHGRNSSLEVSNLGITYEIDNLMDNNEQVRRMFSFSMGGLSGMAPEVCLVKGRGFRGPVLGVGIGTSHNNLTISICSQLGQCGCSEPFIKHVYSNCVAMSSQNHNKSNNDISIVCACPKDKMLSSYCLLVEDQLHRVCSM